MSEESEFGQGLTYCIGLFLAHADRAEQYKKDMDSAIWPEMWFNGASDHLFGLVAPLSNNKLCKEISRWKEKVLHWGHGFPQPPATKKDVYWSIEKAKEFLRRIDEKLLGVKTIKGQWE